MESIKLAREALEGLVDPEQVVDIINKIMGLTDEEALILDPDYQKNKEMEMQSGFQGSESGQQDAGGVESE